MNKLLKLLAIILNCIVTGVIISLIWCWIMPQIWINAPEINILQASFLTLIIKLLFSGSIIYYDDNEEL